MATRTVRICDVDQAHEGAEAHVFALDGEFFTADLCEADRTKLAKAIEPFVAVGTAISGRDALKSANGSTDYDPAVVRAWAQRTGVQVGEKGRVGADVVAKWREAMRVTQ